jgi:hypothetical protein
VNKIKPKKYKQGFDIAGGEAATIFYPNSLKNGKSLRFSSAAKTC